MSGLAKREVPSLSRCLHPIWQLRQGMADASENLLGENNPFHPRKEIISKIDNTIQFVANLPGDNPEEVEIESNDQYLTFSGSHEVEPVRKPLK